MRTLCMMLLACCAAHGATINANFSGKTLGSFHPNNPGVTFDFWLQNDTSNGEKWGTAGILTLDLHDVNLKALMRGLAPGMIRIGGSPVDSVLYDEGGCTPGGTGPSSSYYCSQVRPYVYGCLTKERWTDVLSWAKELGMRILMGVNACHGRTGADEPMDFENIKAFMNATKSLGDSLLEPLLGFEFGNEVTRESSPTATTGMIPSRWSKDAAVVRQIIDETFGKGRMVLAGPADEPHIAEETAHYAAPGVLNLATYHQYPMCEGKSATYAIEPSCLETLDKTAQDISSNLRAANKGVTPWAGETADHYGGGVPGFNNAFQDVFYYAWQLGALPTNNVEMALRQCMMGGDYELVDRNTSMPNPDYFIAAMFKVLTSGGQAQEVVLTPNVTSTGLQVYGFVTTDKANGAVIINTHLQDEHTVSLTGAKWGPTVSAWHLSSPDIHSTQIHLNGEPLVYAGNGAPVPQMNPVVQSTPLTVAPATVVFVRN